jgi:hypothetical protein
MIGNLVDFILRKSSDIIISDAQISEVKSLFCCSIEPIEPKKTQRDLQRDSKVMRKHKKFASLVETKNQHVLPSNTEKNSRQFLFIIAREFSQFSNKFWTLQGIIHR